nr:uncharacterized protein LOC105725502 isoform X2 [Aotus nancymaae]
MLLEPTSRVDSEPHVDSILVRRGSGSRAGRGGRSASASPQLPRDPSNFRKFLLNTLLCQHRHQEENLTCISEPALSPPVPPPGCPLWCRLTHLLSAAAPVGHLADGATVCWALELTRELGLSGIPPTAQCSRLGGIGAGTCPCGVRASFLPTEAKILSLYNDSEPPRKTMHRGVLVTLLQQLAMTLPLWIGKPGDKPPPLCGAIPASGDYVARPGDKVAARVKAVDGDEQWILAEVVSYSHATNRHEVDDIDEEGKERHTLSWCGSSRCPSGRSTPRRTPRACLGQGRAWSPGEAG